MLRVKRIAAGELSPLSLELLKSLAAWKDELNAALGRDHASLLPDCEFEQDHVNFFTSYEGSVWEGAQSALAKPALLELQRHTTEILSYLKGSQALSNPRLEPQRAYLAQLIEKPVHILVFDGKVPLLLPYETPSEEKARLAAIPPATVAPVPTSRGCLFPFLLGLLAFLLLLLALWYFLLRPWPFEGTLTDAINRLLNKEIPTEVMPAKHDDAEKAAPSDEDQKRLEEERLEKERLEKERLEQERLEQERLEKERLEQERLEKERLEQERLEKERLEKLENERKAQEALRLQKEREEAAKKAFAKAVPKCRTLKQQGTMPKLIIAFDGSESMLIDDVAGSSSRLAAAVSAAKHLADTVDKNVEIGLVEINGCPAAKSRGFFSGTQRQALKQTITGIDPRRYGGMTPLIDGLQRISRMSDGVNADAVGILISDGEDTCAATANLDVCQVAKSIHKRKPRLKIHTILIGKDAGKAACVARITGGKVFSPQNASQLDANLQSSGSEMKKVCEE